MLMNHNYCVFQSFEELSNQTEYEFGSIRGGSTMHFFMYSRLDPFKKIWTRMSNSSTDVFVENNQEGVQKVLAEKYVIVHFLFHYQTK